MLDPVIFASQLQLMKELTKRQERIADGHEQPGDRREVIWIGRMLGMKPSEPFAPLGNPLRPGGPKRPSE